MGENGQNGWGPFAKAGIPRSEKIGKILGGLQGKEGAWYEWLDPVWGGRYAVV